MDDSDDYLEVEVEISSDEAGSDCEEQSGASGVSILPPPVTNAVGVAIAGDKNMVRCSVCSELVSKVKFYDHKRKHIPANCDQCEYVGHDANIAVHKRRKHGQQNVPCTKCDAVLSNATSLITHSAVAKRNFLGLLKQLEEAK